MCGNCADASEPFSTAPNAGPHTAGSTAPAESQSPSLAEDERLYGPRRGW